MEETPRGGLSDIIRSTCRPPTAHLHASDRALAGLRPGDADMRPLNFGPNGLMLQCTFAALFEIADHVATHFSPPDSRSCLAFAHVAYHLWNVFDKGGCGISSDRDPILILIWTTDLRALGHLSKAWVPERFCMCCAAEIRCIRDSNPISVEGII